MSLPPESDPATVEEMMRSGHGLAVVIQGEAGDGVPPALGEVRIQEWNQRERVMRAVKVGAACWGLAVVAVFIPLLHFILVPGLLIAGPIVAFVVLGQESVVLGGRGTCPHCQKTMKLVRTAPKFPLSDLCEHCQKIVKIEKA